MSTATPCTCPSPLPTWHPTAPNEDGWYCNNCGKILPGEPPGYRPDLDESDIEEKVDSILLHLTVHDFIYVSNSGHGEWITSSVADHCLETRYFAQRAIIKFILEALGDSDHWRDLGEAIRSGKDTRERCHCGRLATSFSATGGGLRIAQCGEHGMQGLLDSLKADQPPPGTPEPPDPWQVFGDWVAKWRDEHPEDERSELDLVEEYGKAMDGEGEPMP